MRSFTILGESNSPIALELKGIIESKQIPLKLSVTLMVDKIVIDEVNSPAFKVLLLEEPESVRPENYLPQNWRHFDLVILSPWYPSQIGLEKRSFYPVMRPEPVVGVIAEKRKDIVLINDFKFGAVTSSLYGWRLEVLKRLEKRKVKVDVWGPNWRMSKLMEVRKRVAVLRRSAKSPNLSPAESCRLIFFRPKFNLGRAEQKSSTLSEYNFALVIENDKYFLSEKLFDAVFSGNRILYRGPNLEKFSFLENLCVQLPDDIEEAVELIVKRNEIDWSVIEKRCSDFRDNQNSMLFCQGKKVANNIIDTILESIDQL